MRNGGIISAGIRLRQTFNRISDKALDRDRFATGEVERFVNL
jgi:hypothetical protein